MTGSTPYRAVLAATVLTLCLVAQASPASARKAARDPYALRQSISIETQRAEEGRSRVETLTDRERELHGDLAGIEDSLGSLRDDIRDRENRLAQLDRKLEQTRQRREALEHRQDRTRDTLRGLVAALWPLRVQAMQGRTNADPDWAATDRHFAWGASVYDDVRRTLAELAERDRELQAVLAEQERLRAEAEKSVDDINAAKDRLLAKRIDFVRSIREVRAERMNEEQALSQIIAAIDQMNYRLKTMSGGTFKTRKGSLPQPVAGKRFRPDGSGGRLAAAPGRNGASYHTVNGAPVNAVFAGRVAHSDILRGFGRVVIVSHGNQYYTLYAFLSECSVSAGQDVAEGQTLGWTGPYPAAGGSGLYFELRFGQKAINPDEWLTAPR